MANSKQKIAGFTLIEVLVALLILSIGLLGLAGMQVVGLRNSSSSTYRSVAAAIATDMSERMHANLMAVNDDGGNFDLNGDGVANDTDNLGLFDNVDSAMVACGTAPLDCEASGIICGPKDLALFDIDAVACEKLNALPNGVMTITCTDPVAGIAPPCVNAVPYLITVKWNEIQRDGVSREQSVEVRVIP